MGTIEVEGRLSIGARDWKENDANEKLRWELDRTPAGLANYCRLPLALFTCPAMCRSASWPGQLAFLRAERQPLPDEPETSSTNQQSHDCRALEFLFDPNDNPNFYGRRTEDREKARKHFNYSPDSLKPAHYGRRPHAG